MTVSNQSSSIAHTGNGATTTWDFAFRIPTGAAFVGVLDIATEALTPVDASDYTITGLDDDNGGTVEYPLTGDPLDDTKRIVISRILDLTQDTDLTNQTPYYPEVLETQLDRIVMMLQQLNEEIDRAIKVTQGSTTTPNDLVDTLTQASEDAQEAAGDAATQAGLAKNSADDAAASAALTELPNPAVALSYLRRNSGNTAYEAQTAQEVLADVKAVGFDEGQSLTTEHQAQARANIGAPVGEFRNLLINPLFDHNQRVVSGTVVLAAGDYGHDRMRAGAAGCTYTFGHALGVTVLSISAGSLQQVIEAGAFVGRPGDYVLSWTGTAQARIDSGSYGNSGEVTATLDGSANVTVEFGTGTVSLPQFERGYVTDFSARHPALELALCQRYYEVSSGPHYLGKGREGDRQRVGSFVFMTPKRAVPSISFISKTPTNTGIVASTTVYWMVGTAETDLQNGMVDTPSFDAEFH